VGTRKWTLAPPEASSLFQVHAGTYSNRSNIVPHLSDYASNPEAERFSYLEVELSPGDVLFVPPFWWHLVQSVPSQCSGLSIAFNYVFSAREDRIYDDFENSRLLCLLF
jgi:ribosomal protein L16 Arg81 hydroxylase